ncbi:PorT family protein [Spirosoma sp. SC4-14]|uniref:PorT family protein n=1 Tax=Spirosoma sp. SC4-14 TaxID=3128900 RepID=UPI0030D100C3
MLNRFFSLFSSALFITSLAFGQEKLSVSATIAPLFTHTAYDRLYLFPDSDGQVVDPVFLDGSTGSFGYSAGVTVYYTYAPGWSVATGLWYQYQVIKTDRLALAGVGQTSLRNRSFRIPILLNYRSSERKISPYYSFGPLIDFPASSRVIAHREGESTQHLRLSSESGPIFSLLLGAGALYQLNTHVALTAQPTFTYHLGRFGGAHTNFRTYELGLLTQLIYTF